jgi:hypothetical protein
VIGLHDSMRRAVIFDHTLLAELGEDEVNLVYAIRLNPSISKARPSPMP